MIRNICTFIILIILFIPLVEKLHELPVKDYELKGYVWLAGAPRFYLPDFFEGSFQEKVQANLQDHVGYKGYLIALKNQIDYTFFNTLNYGVEEGLDGQLFYWNHIDVHCGHLSITEDSLKTKINECRTLKSKLDSLHIPMVFIFAPGKPGFYEDQLPKKYNGHCSEDNDYNRTLAALRESGFPIIDYNAWFKQIKYKYPYPLFPKLGIHWSYYGASLTADSFSKYVEKTLKVNLPDYSVKEMEVTDQPYESDKDIWSLLNLFGGMKSDSLAYPKFNFNYNPAIHKKPKLLFIGDSFLFPILDTKMFSGLFAEESRYWFYKHELYDMNAIRLIKEPEDVNLKELLKNTDMVVFISTEVLNYRMDFGFSNVVMSDKSIRANK